MLIFICPALIDLIGFVAIFAVSYGAGERGMTMMQVAWLQGLFQIAYMVTSLAAGFVLNRGNARIILFASIVVALVSVAACLLITVFLPLIVAMLVFGVCFAFFFNSFQTFMRGEAPPGSLVRTTALYTLAWSAGSSFGLQVAGSLYRQGALVLVAATVAVGLVVIGILMYHSPRSLEDPSADDQHDAADVDAIVRRRYVWIAWIIIFTTMFVQRPIFSFFPTLSARAGVHPALASLPLCLHMLCQGLFGLAIAWFPRWLYRRWPLVAFQSVAAILFLVIWLAPGFGIAATLISLLGIWSGFAYFMAVYYASNAGNRSRNVGVNEFLVGLGSSAGIFTMEWAMGRNTAAPAAGQNGGDPGSLYLVCALALIVATIVQILTAGRDGRRGFDSHRRESV